MKETISLELYKIFCAVVKMGNMSLAAKTLYLSQPAVSMSIRQLEERLGSSLLIRSAKGVRTTPEGEVLYRYLEQALGLIQTAEEKYKEMVNLQAGSLKIGASDTVISHFLLPYLEKYHALYPEINIKVMNKTTYESLKLLKSGAVDICFVNLPIAAEQEFDITNCMQIQDCFVAGEAYAYLEKEGIVVEELAKYPLLLLEEQSNSRQYLNEYARKNGVVLNPILELGSNELLLSFAKINLGIAHVIEEFTQEQVKEKKLFQIPVFPPIPKRWIGMVKLKDVTFSYCAKAFVTLFSFQKDIDKNKKII